MARKIKKMHYLLGTGVLLLLFFIAVWFVVRSDILKESQKREKKIARSIATLNIEMVSVLLKDNLKVFRYIDNEDIVSNEDNFKETVAFIYKQDKSIKHISLQESTVKSVVYEVSVDENDHKRYLHILVPLKHKPGFICNLKVDLLELHQKIVQLNIYATVYVTVSCRGVYISHPDEKLLGTQVNDIDLAYQKKAFASKDRLLSDVHSEFLNVDVYRYYYFSSKEESACVFTASMPYFDITNFVDKTEKSFLLIAVIAVIFFIIIFLIGTLVWRKEFLKRRRIEQKNMKLELKASRQKKIAVTSELEMLKKGLNPHFLFNSLSSLRILVGKDPKMAKKFTVTLSNIYRYMLKYEKRNLVNLEEEMQFTKDYICLQKIRFSNKIQSEIILSENLNNSLLPPVSIQLLVENCVKHTVISEEEPLCIKIFEENGYIVVTNNYKPRLIEEEHGGKGLVNLKKRYALLIEKPCEFSVQKNLFVAKIPIVYIKQTS